MFKGKSRTVTCLSRHVLQGATTDAWGSTSAEPVNLVQNERCCSKALNSRIWMLWIPTHVQPVRTEELYNQRSSKWACKIEEITSNGQYLSKSEILSHHSLYVHKLWCWRWARKMFWRTWHCHIDNDNKLVIPLPCYPIKTFLWNSAIACTWMTYRWKLCFVRPQWKFMTVMNHFFRVDVRAIFLWCYVN